MNARTGVGWLCVIAFGVLLAVSVGAGDTVYTGNDLLKDLQVGKPGRLVKAEEMVETAQRRAQAVGYISGISSFLNVKGVMTLASEGGGTVRIENGHCLPGGITDSQLALVVENHLEGHPETLHRPAAFHALFGIIAAFCPANFTQVK